ncbi:MAG: hypothetical protein RLZ98_2380 [Pseudomonadota bacterium]|jgi:omega-6 fatty acid desaturase (delta-12 desaturase)
MHQLTLQRPAPLGPDPVAGLRSDWTKILKPYRTPCNRRSIFELLVTVAPLVGLWTLAWLALQVSYVLTLALAVPAAGLLVRLFLIQHDCGHGAFFTSRKANTWLGRVLGVFTLTPYDLWQRKHALHHATSGNLGERGMGDVATLTVAEYRARSWWGRLVYRLYRHPVIMFGLGPAYLFLLNHRLPSGMMLNNGLWPWVSAMGTNVGIAGVAVFLAWCVGWQAFLLVQLPITLLAASIGVWLFYIQHQFEDTYWASSEDWNHQDAALLGSSYYELPRILRWFTANIGVHHVHHLTSRIPFYRLQKILRDHPELRNLRRMTLRDSLRTVGLSLWDEHRQRLVRFSDVRMAR